VRSATVDILPTYYGLVLEKPGMIYTREGANQLLDEVRERLVRLRQAYAEIAGHRASMASAASGNGGDAGASRWLASSRTAADELSWFVDRDIVVRDIEQGLIDFPGRREGREIYLCWRLGEEAVDFWHDKDTGFPGRQPL
jgi:hypothetical protein